MPQDRKPEYFKGSQLKVGVIRCGYVGLPLCLRFAEAGHRVIGLKVPRGWPKELCAGIR